MKRREFEAIGRRLVTELNGFVVNGPMMLISPIGDILRGVYFDRSDFDAKAFYAEILMLPLYVPTQMIHFNYGSRLRGADNDWRGDSATLVPDLVKAIQIEALPFFRRNATLSGVLEYLGEHVVGVTNAYVNPHRQEAFAYTLFRADRTEEALMALDDLESICDPDVEWNETIRRRTRIVRQMALQGPKAVKDQLDVWRKETIKSLQLTEFC